MEEQLNRLKFFVHIDKLGRAISSSIFLHNFVFLLYKIVNYNIKWYKQI